MSETAAQIAQRFIPEEGWRVAQGYVGQPMPDHEIRITDGRPHCDTWPTSHARLFRWKLPDHESWFVTSDLGYVDEKDSCLLLDEPMTCLLVAGANSSL